MCRQEEMIRAALHEAVDNYSASRIEREVLRRRCLSEPQERADVMVGRFALLCALSSRMSFRESRRRESGS
jgi:hypothetical protein